MEMHTKTKYEKEIILQVLVSEIDVELRWNILVFALLYSISYLIRSKSIAG